MNEEQKAKLEMALANVEDVREQVKGQLNRIREQDNMDERQVHLLVTYNLEMLDVKMRLKDFIDNLHLVHFD